MKEPVTCTISDVCMKDEQQPKLQPILVTFQHGTLLHEEARNLQCRVSRDKMTKKRMFSVTTGHNNVKYNGSEENDVKSICRTMIAIRNCKTNKVRLIEADNVLLSPFIEEKKLSKSIPNLSLRENIATLHKSFGSKNVKRRTEQQERLKTDVTLLTDKLIQAVENVDVSVLHPEDSTPSIVPCNLDARTVEDVYTLSDLITAEELDSMKNKAIQLRANANTLNKNQYSLFLFEHLPKILAKEKNQMANLEALLYIDCLLKFFSTPFKTYKADMDQICPFSKIVNDKILVEFTMKSTVKSRLRPKKLKDKALCHMIVIALLISDFKFNVTSLFSSARESITKAQQLSRALGATLNKGSELVLKLPLAKPYLSFSSKRK